MSYKTLGIKVEIDHIKDEEKTTIGLMNQMPIALFLLLSCQSKEPLIRYMSLITYDKNAYVLAEQFNNDNNFQLWVKALADQFDYEEPFVSRKDNNSVHEIKPMSPGAYEAYMQMHYNPPKDAVLDLYVYAKQFLKIFCMKTASFNSYDTGVILECRQRDANFWAREEFQNVNKFINIALEHIIVDVMRVMKLKGMKFNEETMTVEVEGFTPYVLVESMMY